MKTKEKVYRIKYKYNGEWLLSGMIRERDYSQALLGRYRANYGEAEWFETDGEY